MTGAPGAAGPPGPPGINAVLLNAQKRITTNQPTVDIAVGPMQANYTGGAPGTPTYAWSLIAPSYPAASFGNPGDASSQIVVFPTTSQGSHDQGVRVTITDSQGHAATQDAIATAIHETLQ